MVFRIGGDEFVILMSDCLPDQAESACARLNNKFKEVNELASLAYGVVEIPIGFLQEDSILRGNAWLEKVMDDADRQMYINKQSYKSCN